MAQQGAELRQSEAQSWACTTPGGYNLRRSRTFSPALRPQNWACSMPGDYPRRTQTSPHLRPRTGHAARQVDTPRQTQDTSPHMHHARWTPWEGPGLHPALAARRADSPGDIFPFSAPVRGPSAYTAPSATAMRQRRATSARCRPARRPPRPSTSSSRAASASRPAASCRHGHLFVQTQHDEEASQVLSPNREQAGPACCQRDSPDAA